MINGKQILGIIPARGGSKGVPRKNIRDVAGKPLIAWTIEAAKKSKYLDRLILSSEDEEIINVAKSWGCEVPFVRPVKLATDYAPGMDPVLHALQQLPHYEYIVLLQPTSPLRTFEDIDGCIEKCIHSGAPSCVSVVEVDKHPYWMFTINDDDIMTPVIANIEAITRRQDLPKTFALNGAVYVAERDLLTQTSSFLSDQTVSYQMPKSRSIDIDDELDLNICEILLGIA